MVGDPIEPDRHGWQWKIDETIKRLTSKYHLIGSKTAKPYLALIYPLEEETNFLRELLFHLSTLGEEYQIITINLLEIVNEGQQIIGAAEDIKQFIEHPMPGSDPKVDIARLWFDEALDSVRKSLDKVDKKKPIIVLEYLAALYPISSPRYLMHYLWNNDSDLLYCPMIVPIPGSVGEIKIYNYLNRVKEPMYRGELL